MEEPMVAAAPSLVRAWQAAFATLNRGRPGIQGVLECSEAWAAATDYLGPRTIEQCDAEPDAYRCYPDSVVTAIGLLKQVGMVDNLRAWYLDATRQMFATRVKPELEQAMSQWETTRQPNILPHLAERLAMWLTVWSRPLQTVPSDEKALTALSLQFCTLLHASLSSSFFDLINAYLHASLSATPLIAHRLTEDQDSAPGESTSKVQFPTSSSPLPSSFPSTQISFLPTIRRLNALGLTARIENLVSALVFEDIEARVKSMAEGKFEVGALDRLVDWLDSEVAPLVEGVFSSAGTGKAEEWYGRFRFCVYKTLCELRCRELFDIIHKWGEEGVSKPALEDLKACLRVTGQRSLVIASLNESTRKRLLVQGVDTASIVIWYIRAVEVMYFLDPPGVLLASVAEPVWKYLRSRNDTVRVIVRALVEEDQAESKIARELEQGEPLPLELGKGEEIDYLDETWEPAPVDAGPYYKSGKKPDIITSLANIYDTKTVFVPDIQASMAQRLLNIKDYDLTKERQKSELLKMRFGESTLQVIDIMVKDLDDSRQIDYHIHNEHKVDSPLHPTITSKQFWPTLESISFELPGQLASMRSTYVAAFEKHKPGKKLHVLPMRGKVTVELELQDRTLELEVGLLEASVMELFQGRPTWSFADTMSTLHVENSPAGKAALRRALNIWIKEGVLKPSGEDADVFELLEIKEDTAPRNVEIDEEPGVPAVSERDLQEMRVFWAFIRNMLRSLRAQSTAQVHSRLKAFVPNYKRTEQELGFLLADLQKEGLVMQSDGVWKLA